MYINFVFRNGSNPYITWKNDRLFRMIRNYDCIQYDEQNFVILNKRPYHKNEYRYNQSILRDFAIEWQAVSGDLNYSYDLLAGWHEFFWEYGAKYGLLREFQNNGIC